MFFLLVFCLFVWVFFFFAALRTCKSKIWWFLDVGLFLATESQGLKKGWNCEWLVLRNIDLMSPSWVSSYLSWRNLNKELHTISLNPTNISEPLLCGCIKIKKAILFPKDFMILFSNIIYSHVQCNRGQDAAAAAKSHQTCPTLCDPIDGSPAGSSVPGILQARILEWVFISFFNAWKWKVKVKSLSHVRLLATPWTVAYQAPPSMGFSRQEYGSGLPLPSLGQEAGAMQRLGLEPLRRKSRVAWKRVKINKHFPSKRLFMEEYELTR